MKHSSSAAAANALLDGQGCSGHNSGQSTESKSDTKRLKSQNLPDYFPTSAIVERQREGSATRTRGATCGVLPSNLNP